MIGQNRNNWPGFFCKGTFFFFRSWVDNLMVLKKAVLVLKKKKNRWFCNLVVLLHHCSPYYAEAWNKFAVLISATENQENTFACVVVKAVANQLQCSKIWST